MRMSAASWVVLLVAVLLGLWLFTSTEWKDVEVDTPARGEALTNSTYVLQKLAQHMGVKVVKATGFEKTPPAHATMMLNQAPDNLLPENRDRIKQWVARGGHLVVPSSWLDGEERAKMGVWPPMELQTVDDAQAADANPAKEVTADGDHCSPLQQSVGASRVFAGQDSPLSYCGWEDVDRQAIKGVGPVLWSLDSSVGPQAMRVQAGQGTVTASRVFTYLFDNTQIFKGHHGAIIVALLGMHAGQELWIVEEDAREPLPLWLWNQADMVWVLAGLALVMWLWHVAPRFGPMKPALPLERRSMAEQLSGTAAFMKNSGRAALHAAQRRALEDVAMVKLPRYRSMSVAQKIAAISEATGCDRAALEQAMQMQSFLHQATWLDACALMERVRRRLTTWTYHSP